MLRVKIELVPHGDETRARTLHVMEIAADRGTKTTSTHAGYNARLYAKGSRVVTKTGRVGQFPRLSKNAWHLLARMLRNMGY